MTPSRNPDFGRLRTALAAIMLGAFAATAVPAAAESAWKEPRYDPPAGRSWRLESSSREEVTIGGATRWHGATTRATVSFDAKAEGGFRVTYVEDAIVVEGDDDQVGLLKSVAEAIRGASIRGLLDASGRPLRVENMAELKERVSGAIDRVVAEESKKDASGAQVLRQILEGMLLDDGKAANLYFDGLPSLASGQNTGLKPGEERRSVLEEEVMGQPMRSEVVLGLVQAEGTKAHYRQTESYDPDSVRALIAKVARQIAERQGKDAAGVEARTRELAGMIEITRDGGTDIFVEDGMARRVASETVATSTGLGVKVVRRSTRTVTLTPLP